MEYIFSVFLGYLLGSVNPAYIFGRLKGFDIRQRGSKSAGASNAKICLGWGYFIVTVIYDISKAYISRFVISKIFPNNLYLPVLDFKLYRSGNGDTNRRFPGIYDNFRAVPADLLPDGVPCLFCDFGKTQSKLFKIKNRGRNRHKRQKNRLWQKGIIKKPTIFLQFFLFHLTSSSISVKYCGNFFLGEEK